MSTAAVPPIIVPGAGGGRTEETILILGVLGVGAWFLFTRLPKPVPLAPAAAPPAAAPPPVKVQRPYQPRDVLSVQARPLNTSTTTPPVIAPAVVNALPPPAKPAPVTAPAGVIAAPPPAPPAQPRPVSSSLFGATARPGVVTMTGGTIKPAPVSVPQSIAPRPSPPPVVQPAPALFKTPVKVTSMVFGKALTPKLSPIGGLKR